MTLPQITILKTDDYLNIVAGKLTPLPATISPQDVGKKFRIQHKKMFMQRRLYAVVGDYCYWV